VRTRGAAAAPSSASPALAPLTVLPRAQRPQDTATNVKVTVPSGATTGRIKVVTDGGKVESATNFTVTW